MERGLSLDTARPEVVFLIEAHRGKPDLVTGQLKRYEWNVDC